MKQLIVLSILVMTSLFSTNALADKPLVRVEITKEDAAKLVLGQVLNRTGLASLAGIKTRGKVEVQATACIKNRRGDKICAIDQEKETRIP